MMTSSSIDLGYVTLAIASCLGSCVAVHGIGVIDVSWSLYTLPSVDAWSGDVSAILGTGGCPLFGSLAGMTCESKFDDIGIPAEVTVPLVVGSLCSGEASASCEECEVPLVVGGNVGG